MKYKVYIAIMVGLCGLSLMVIGYLNESGKQDVVEIPSTKQIEGQNKTETTTTSTISTTTKKTTKKVVKTTKTVQKTTKKTTKSTTKVQKVATASKQEYIDYAKSYGNYDDKQMSCLINLWNHESGWNPNSVNKKSGACGIPQALPCSKIKNVEGSNDWKAQIRWGIKYINYRYKTPCKAWEHFKKKNWY